MATVTADLVEIARRRLTSSGVFVMSPADLNTALDVDDDAWRRFRTHWDDLAPDTYAGTLGTRRLRRYGHFRYRTDDACATLMPHHEFVQPQDSNPLYVRQDRHFEPLTARFAADPLLHMVLNLLGRIATALDTLCEWSAKVHPFRVLASADADGQPTPEGLHHDGVTLVTSLLIDRRNATGGESLVVDLDGRRLLSTTLSRPGTLLLGDDRRTLHGVSPIRPVDPAAPAQRDVLVITYAPPSPR
ncbi:2OG-Fe dioxygenase family protein [Mycobacterium hubeiense]|uniref:2OG-Fe dioxygenase family protein n=1 Tax=Mycobacterium hubeiense TaxID=1867256 RepID=UPI000C7ED230|nr:2OG-Fe dioxygenase family protein [Mycobacterium sp. QGD 101]